MRHLTLFCVVPSATFHMRCFLCNSAILVRHQVSAGVSLSFTSPVGSTSVLSWLHVIWSSYLYYLLLFRSLPCLAFLIRAWMSSSVPLFLLTKLPSYVNSFTSVLNTPPCKRHTIATFATNTQQLFLISALTSCFPITSSLPVLSILTLVFISAMTIFTSLHGTCSKTICNWS